MEFYNNHYVEVDPNDESDSSYGISLSHRLLTDDRLADMRRPKLIHFYVNGDIFYKGIDLSITPNRYMNFQDLLNDLEKKVKPNISLPMGIRKIFTRKGKQIYSTDELEDCEAYVIAGPEPFKALVYSQKPHLNRKSKKLSKLRNYYSQHVGHHYAHHSDNDLQRNTYKPKVITVIKKSKNSHIALRVILNKCSLISIGQLIESLNNSFESQIKDSSPIIKLFTIGGKYVKSIEDILRPDDVFVGIDKDGVTWKEINNIICDLFKDDYEKINIYLQRWEINQEIRSSNLSTKSEHPKKAIQVNIDNKSEVKHEDSTNIKQSSKKSIKFERSQSMDEIVPAEIPVKKLSKVLPKEKNNQMTEDLVIPIGKGPLPTSHLQNIIRNELQSRRHLECTRKALIDREKARQNQKRMMYFERPNSDIEIFSDDEIRRIKTPMSEHLGPRYSSQHYKDNFMDIEKYKCMPFMQPTRNYQLIQPIMSREILHSTSHKIFLPDESKLLKNRPRQNSLSVYLTKYRTLNMDKREVEKNLNEMKGKTDRSGKIPELDSLRQFQEIYQIITQIGKGDFCRVFYGKSATEEENEEVALKIVSKALLDGREYLIDNEIDMLLRCRHEFVAHLLHQFETPKEVILVMELAPGGDLLVVLESNGVLSELQTSCVISKLSTALLFLQSQNIIHRNISLENILVKSISHHNVDVLLADFSNAIIAKESSTGLFGSPMFASPEMLLKHPYKHEVDCWSLGILMYMLLSTNHPFMIGTNNRSQLYNNIINNAYDFHGYQWGSIMREAKELIDGLLNPKSFKRLTAMDVLCHPWILMEGISTSLCGRDINHIQKSRREDVENELKVLKSKSETKIDLKKQESTNKDKKEISTKKTGHSLLGLFKNKKREESQIDIEMKK